MRHYWVSFQKIRLSQVFNKMLDLTLNIHLNVIMCARLFKLSPKLVHGDMVVSYQKRYLLIYHVYFKASVVHKHQCFNMNSLRDMTGSQTFCY